MRLHKLPAALFAVVAALALLADIPVTQNSATLATSNQVLATHCGGGQSMAVIQALATTIPGPTPTASPTPPATPTPGPTSTPIAWSGTITIYTAADLSNQPGPSASPFNITPANSTSYTQTITSAPGKLYVTLASDQWVLAQLTTATTGVVPVTVTCSGSVARVTLPGASGAPGPTGPAGSPGPSGAPGSTPPLPISVANGGTGTSSPNPTVTTGAGPCTPTLALSGTWPSLLTTITGNCTIGQLSGVSLQAAAATPTPQAGTIGLTDGVWIGPAPDPENTIMPNAIRISTTNGGGSFVRIGTSTASYQGINGQGLMLNNGSNFFAVNQNGDIGVDSINDANNLFFQQDNSEVYWPNSSTSDGACYLIGHSGGGYVGLISSAGTCTFYLPSLTTYSAMCTGTGLVAPCSGDTQNSGEVVCTTVAGTSCTQTATVRSAAKCQATMETSDSTLAGPYYAPTAHTSGTTLTVTMTAFVAGSANLAANYWCP